MRLRPAVHVPEHLESRTPVVLIKTDYMVDTSKGAPNQHTLLPCEPCAPLAAPEGAHSLRHSAQHMSLPLDRPWIAQELLETPLHCRMHKACRSVGFRVLHTIGNGVQHMPTCHTDAAQ